MIAMEAVFAIRWWHGVRWVEMTEELSAFLRKAGITMRDAEFTSSSESSYPWVHCRDGSS